MGSEKKLQSNGHRSKVNNNGHISHQDSISKEHHQREEAMFSSTGPFLSQQLVTAPGW